MKKAKLITLSLISAFLILFNSLHPFIRPSFTAETAETPPPPQPKVTAVYPLEINAGEKVTITVQGANLGGESPEAYFQASFPSNPSYIQIVQNTAPQVRVYREGTELWAGYGSYKKIAQYPLVEGWAIPWPSNEQYMFSVEVIPPEREGDFVFYIKMTARTSDGSWTYAPSSGLKDQQDEYVEVCRIRVKPSFLTPILGENSNIDPKSVKAGESFTAYYYITNPNPYAVDVGLGCSIRLSGSSMEIVDPANDIVVSVSPGTNRYSRSFKVPEDAEAGYYDWVLAIWSGAPGSSTQYQTTGWKSGLEVSPPGGSFDPDRGSFSAVVSGDRIQLSLSYANSLGENVVVMFVISLASSGRVVDAPTGTAYNGQTGTVTATSKSMDPGTYQASWMAFRASDTSFSNPISWSTSYEIKTVTIESQPSEFDFSISASPSSVTVEKGKAIEALVTVNLISGTTGRVDLTLSGLPSNVGTYGFNPAYGNPAFTSRLSIGAFDDAPTGTYTLTITGSGGGKMRSTSITLTVTAPPMLDLTVELVASQKSEYNPGETVTIYAKLKNTGGVYIDQITGWCTIASPSGQTVFDQQWSNPNYGLSIGAIWVFEQSWTIPSNAEIGYYKIMTRFTATAAGTSRTFSRDVSNAFQVKTGPTPQYGSLRGRVTDVNTGNPIGGAQVSVSGPISQTQTTGTDGDFGFALPVGTYTVTASASGYESQTKSGTVPADSTLWLNFELQPTQQPKQTPIAYIDSISPNPAEQGKNVSFSGHGSDPDGYITEYEWRSSLDGRLSSSQSFDTASLSTGTHTIYFRVKDNDGLWSKDATATLEIKPPPANSLQVEIVSPPSPSHGSTVTSLPITFRVRVTSQGQPVSGARVIFSYGDGGTGRIGEPTYSDGEGYATATGFQSLAEGSTVRWWASADKVGYQDGISSTYSFTYQPTQSTEMGMLDLKVERVRIEKGKSMEYQITVDRGAIVAYAKGIHSNFISKNNYEITLYKDGNVYEPSESPIPDAALIKNGDPARFEIVLPDSQHHYRLVVKCTNIGWFSNEEAEIGVLVSFVTSKQAMAKMNAYQDLAYAWRDPTREFLKDLIRFLGFEPTFEGEFKFFGDVFVEFFSATSMTFSNVKALVDIWRFVLEMDQVLKDTKENSARKFDWDYHISEENEMYGFEPYFNWKPTISPDAMKEYYTKIGYYNPETGDGVINQFKDPVLFSPNDPYYPLFISTELGAMHYLYAGIYLDLSKQDEYSFRNAKNKMEYLRELLQYVSWIPPRMEACALSAENWESGKYYRTLAALTGAAVANDLHIASVKSYENIKRNLKTVATTTNVATNVIKPPEYKSVDINGDGVIDYKDITILTTALGTKYDDPTYNLSADLNEDGKIDLADLAILTSQMS